MTEAGRQTGRWRVFFWGGGQSFPANVANVRFFGNSFGGKISPQAPSAALHHITSLSLWCSLIVELQIKVKDFVVLKNASDNAAQSRVNRGSTAEQ